MPKRKSLRDRARGWTYYHVADDEHAHDAAPEAWLAGYRAAQRDAGAQSKRADALQAAIERSFKEPDGHEWLRAWMQGDVT